MHICIYYLYTDQNQGIVFMQLTFCRLVAWSLAGSPPRLHPPLLESPKGNRGGTPGE